MKQKDIKKIDIFLLYITHFIISLNFLVTTVDGISVFPQLHQWGSAAGAPSLTWLEAAATTKKNQKTFLHKLISASNFIFF